MFEDRINDNFTNAQITSETAWKTHIYLVFVLVHKLLDKESSTNGVRLWLVGVYLFAFSCGTKMNGNEMRQTTFEQKMEKELSAKWIGVDFLF